MYIVTEVSVALSMRSDCDLTKISSNALTQRNAGEHKLFFVNLMADAAGEATAT